MHRRIEQRLDWLASADNARLIRGGLIGIEKESLRIDRSGRLSTRAHPASLGSALTHPYITTDYAEALLEFVTPAFADVDETVRFLSDIHQQVYTALADEMLWVASMPCLLSDPDDIPIAYYGDSNLGRMKTIYRRGLSHRYRPAMQAISGVHFNYSLPEAFWPAFKEMEQDRDSLQHFVSEQYMALIRNFRRYGWIVLYLFGASPAMCRSFLPGGHRGLKELDVTGWHAPFGTTLRMSDLGYQNETQASLKISVNSLDEYIADLTRAISTPNPDYKKIGVCVDGEYRQLNANYLQIENEYYSSIRPKRRIRSGERPTLALRRAGVEYVELRALDVGIEHPVGVYPAQLRFLEAFLVFCLLRDSPPITTQEQAEIDDRDVRTACEGRRPGLKVAVDGREVPVTKWGTEILDAMTPVCELLDDGDAEEYRTALRLQREAMVDPERTPSARMLREITGAGLSFFEYALERAQAYRTHFNALPALSPEKQARFDEAVVRSREAIQTIESRDEMSFQDYLKHYFRDIDVGS